MPRQRTTNRANVETLAAAQAGTEAAVQGIQEKHDYTLQYS